MQIFLDMDGVVANFMQHVRNTRKPLVDGHEGRKALEVIIGIYQSSKTGRIVKFPIR